jgi:hypothetical protein
MPAISAVDNGKAPTSVGKEVGIADGDVGINVGRQDVGIIVVGLAVGGNVGLYVGAMVGTTVGFVPS